MWQKHCPRAFDCQANGRDQDAAGDKNRSQWFGFAVTVRVRFVWRPRRKTETAPDDNRTRDIDGGFHPVSNERIGITEDAAENFENCESDIHDQTDQSESRSGLQTY